MTRYIISRLLQSVVVLLVIVTASFFIMKATPGSPLAKDRQLDEATEQQLMERYHLDKPAFTQYLIYLGNLAQGDLGESIKLKSPVSQIIKESAKYSLIIGTQAMLFALLLGVPLGLIAGLKQNTPTDYAAMGTALVGVSIPNFVLAPIFILIFAAGLGWFDSGGWDSWKDSILPSASLGFYYAAYIARLTRSGMLEVIRQDYIRTARAKGLSEKTVVLRHALRGALLPVVSYLGPAFAAALTGSVVIEKVYNVPGLGSHFVNGAFNRDYFLVLGVIVIYSALLVFLNLAVDLMYTFLDPRVSYDSES